LVDDFLYTTARREKPAQNALFYELREDIAEDGHYLRYLGKTEDLQTVVNKGLKGINEEKNYTRISLCLDTL